MNVLDQIAAALGRASANVPTSDERTQWSLWIDDARMLINARLGDLDELDQSKLNYVVREAVLAHIRNPDDATQVTRSILDASESKTYRSAKGRVVIIDEWWDLLNPTDGRGAFTLDTVDTTTMHLPWCDIQFGGEDCSCGADIAGYPIYENLP